MSDILQASVLSPQIFGANVVAGPIVAPPGMLLWYKAGVEVFSDAGITPAVDTDPVYQWNDQSATGLDVQQVNVADRPIYDAVLDGYPALTFTTAGGHYLEKSGEPDMTGAVTVLAAIRLDASGGGEIINSFQVGTAVNNQLRFAVDAVTDKLVFGRPYGAGDITSTALVPRSQWAVVAAQVGPATGAADTMLYPQGTGSGESRTLNDDGTQNAGDLWIGRFDSQFFTSNLDGAIGEILVYGYELTAPEMSQALAYLEQQHGLL